MSGKYVTFAKTQRPKDDRLTVIIPTASPANRNKTIGARSLIKLSEYDNVLSRQVNILRNVYQELDILVVVGHNSDKICRTVPGLRYIENDRFAETSVVRSIALGLRATITDRVLIVYGDLVFNREIFNFDNSKSSIVVNSKSMKDSEVGVIVQDGLVTNLAYDLDKKWSQIVNLCGKELGLFRQYVNKREFEKCMCHEILNMVISDGGKFVAASPSNAHLVEIDCHKDIEIACQVK